MEKLKPCPFCGGTIRVYTEQVDARSKYYYFACCDCDMVSFLDYPNDKTQAIEAWKRRAYEKQVD